MPRGGVLSVGLRNTTQKVNVSILCKTFGVGLEYKPSKTKNGRGNVDARGMAPEKTPVQLFHFNDFISEMSTLVDHIHLCH